MPTKIQLSFDKKNKQWRKMINGKRYNLGPGNSRSDLPSYRLAYAKYLAILANEASTGTNDGIRFSERLPVSSEYEIMKVQYAKKYGGTGLRDTSTILGLIDRFIYDMMNLHHQKVPKISAPTLQRYCIGFNHPKYGIIKFIGTKTVGKPDSASNLERTPSRRRILEYYHKQLAVWQTQVRNPLSPEYANLFYATAKKWYKWMWEKEYIQELPRVMFRLKPFQLTPNKKNLKPFTIEEVRHLYKMAYGQNSKRWTYIMRCWILLGTNCAFGPHELATLTREECDLDEGRISRFREKTGIYASWKLWPETIQYLKACFELENDPLVYQEHFSAIPQKHNHHLVFKSQQNNPLSHSRFVAGGATKMDTVNKRFKNLKAKWWMDERSGMGFKSLRRLSATLVDTLELNDRGRAISMLLGHMSRSGPDANFTHVGYMNYVKPSFTELDSAIDQLRELYKFHEIVDNGRKDYKTRFVLDNREI